MVSKTQIVSICALAALLSGSHCGKSKGEKEAEAEERAVRTVLTEEGWTNTTTKNVDKYSPVCKGINAYYLEGTTSEGSRTTGIVCCGHAGGGCEKVTSDCYMRGKQ